MVQCAQLAMEKLNQFVINLASQTATSEVYQWTLDDAFFKAVGATEVQRGSVDATLTVKRTSGAFELTFRFRGIVILPCDRCLEDMEQPVDAERTMRAKLGEEYDDDGELLTVPYDGRLNVAWHFYEFIALEIPLRHVHPDGQCAGNVEEILNNN